jgi:c-di-GMP-binding flagellar brake protein YcgR
MEEGDHMEQRSFRRVNVHAEVTVKSQEHNFKAELENISMGGLFARPGTPVAVKAGDIFEITVLLPVEAKNDSIIVNGMAIRITDNSIAFRFLDTDQDTLRALFSFIYLR